MKQSRKRLFSAAFCIGMLSLSACTEPVTVYGPPSSMQSQNGMQPVTEEPQEVYGPPLAGEDAPAEESAASAAEEDSAS